MNYLLRAACGCNIGNRRHNNEDNFCFDGYCLPIDNSALDRVLLLQTSSKKSMNVGVFDGMGGHEEGELASHIAASVYCNEIKKGVKNPLSFQKAIITKMHACVLEKAEHMGNNMGTTASIMSILEGRYYACNIGDSRIFRFSDRKLIQISKDHTDEIFLRSHGILDRKAGLTQYVGLNSDGFELDPYFNAGEINEGDGFIICSDGLTDMVEEDKIEAEFEANKNPEDIVNSLMKMALDAGGRDNITIQIILIGAAQKNGFIRRILDYSNHK